MDHKLLVVHELTQGKEFAEQLKIHLKNPSSSHETQEILIHNILNSYEKSLSLLTIRGLTANGSTDEPHLHGGKGIIRRMESQVLFSENPHSEESDPEFKDLDHKDFVAKRKSNGSTIEKWKKQVKVRGDMEFEEALDDGYSWRKYGQKDILGAKHPRGYYRCTYRQLQGCLATKQVQRTNDDPNIFNLTYHGSHTCHPASDHTSPPLLLPWSPSSPPKIQHPPPQNQLLWSPEIRQTDHKAITNNQENHSLHFRSTCNNKFVFPYLNSTSDGINTPSFITPTTSGSTYFMTSQPQVSMCEKIESTTVVVESELNDIVSGATLSTSFHNADEALPFGELEFGSTFSFNNSIFFDH